MVNAVSGRPTGFSRSFRASPFLVPDLCTYQRPVVFLVHQLPREAFGSRHPRRILGSTVPSFSFRSQRVFPSARTLRTRPLGPSWWRSDLDAVDVDAMDARGLGRHRPVSLSPPLGGPPPPFPTLNPRHPPRGTAVPEPPLPLPFPHGILRGPTVFAVFGRGRGAGVGSGGVGRGKATHRRTTRSRHDGCKERDERTGCARAGRWRCQEKRDQASHGCVPGERENQSRRVGRRKGKVHDQTRSARASATTDREAIPMRMMRSSDVVPPDTHRTTKNIGRCPPWLDPWSCSRT